MKKNNSPLTDTSVAIVKKILVNKIFLFSINIYIIKLYL